MIWHALHRARSIAALLIVAALVNAARGDDDAAWTLQAERWYILEIAGTSAGVMRQAVHERGDRIRSVTETRLSMRRGDTPINTAIDTAFIETRDGRPISMTLRQSFSREPVTTEWTFTPEHVEQSVTQHGRTTTVSRPLPEGVWLTPRAATRFRAERLAADASEIIYRTLDPQAGLQPVTIRSRQTGRASFEHDGREIPVTVWSTTSELLPTTSVDWYSADGQLVRQEIPSGLGRLVTRLATRDAAAVASGAAPELFIRSFIQPDHPIPDVSATISATYRVRAVRGELPTIPSAGAQRAEPPDDNEVVIRVILDDPLPANPGEAAQADYRAASSFINADDPHIRRLAERAANLADAPDLRALAEAMRRFVHRFIVDKSLDEAFASAATTARSRAGDCSEHAVLLAAMLRAADIPARVATGLVYVDAFAGKDDIFGWHMWTQALIDDRWIDLDATLSRSFHAGHILISTSALDDGAVGLDLAALLLLMGNLEIDVISVAHEDASDETSRADESSRE